MKHDYRGGFLKDSDYQRSAVPMTKEEVRWLSLLKLRIAPADHVLDIGAGTGSVAIGAARLAPEGAVTAVEKSPEAAALIRSNGERLGATNLQVLEGTAPEVLEGLESFDCIFIGGSSGEMARLVDWAAERLPAGGRLVVNTVTVENGAEALKAMKLGPFEALEIIQVSVARGRSAGQVTLWEAQNPVTILSAVRRNHER